MSLRHPVLTVVLTASHPYMYTYIHAHTHTRRLRQLEQLTLPTALLTASHPQPSAPEWQQGVIVSHGMAANYNRNSIPGANSLSQIYPEVCLQCSVLQRVVMCCSVLQCVAVCGRVLQCCVVIFLLLMHVAI